MSSQRADLNRGHGDHDPEPHEQDRKLKHVGKRHRPEPTGERVSHGNGGGEDDRRAEVETQHDAHRRAERGQDGTGPEQLAG